MSEEIKNRGMLSVIKMFKKTDDENNTADGCVKYNDDGTISIDIWRTGVWRHPWYGTVSVDEKFIDSLMRNFEDEVMGRKVSFDYHHEHRANYGMPVRLRKEQREGKFAKRPFTMLVADVMLTARGKEDTESGQVLNFSSEIANDYVHNEMMAVVCMDDDGNVVKDGEGNIIEKHIAKRFGPTLVGGAVTNNPFITELNPAGLGGNLSSFKMSMDGGMMVANPTRLNADNFASMCFSLDNDSAQGDGQEETQAAKYEAAIESKLFDDLLNDGASYVLVNSCLYDSSEFKAGDTLLPDSAFAFVYEIKSDSGNVIKVRKMPHHTGEVDPANEHFSVDKDRLTSIVGRFSQTAELPANIKNAVEHINSHASAAFSQDNSTTVEIETMPNDTSTAPAVAAPTDAEKPKTFSMDDVKNFVAASVSDALSKQREELQRQFTAETSSLKAHMEAEQTRSYSLEVDSFVSKIADGKATPAFQKVARYGLIGNKDAKIRYYSDETKSFSDISLQEFVNKIAATADFDSVGTGADVTETTVDGVERVNAAPDKKVFSADDVKALTEDPAMFAAFMQDHNGALSGFSSVAAAAAKNAGK